MAWGGQSKLEREETVGAKAKRWKCHVTNVNTFGRGSGSFCGWGRGDNSAVQSWSSLPEGFGARVLRGNRA